VRLLFDKNLSPKLAPRLAEIFPGSKHVDDLGLSWAPDMLIAARARGEDYVLCTKDTDFAIGNDLYDAATGPSVILIRLGNVSTNDIERALRTHAQSLERKALRPPFHHEIS